MKEVIILKTWKQCIKHLTSKQYEMLREMCYLSKNIYNESVYNIRQHYFQQGEYLRYEANYALLKMSKNYTNLGGSVAQQSMKFADYAFKSFFGLLKLAKSGKYESWKIRLPNYLPNGSLYKICFVQAQILHGRFKVPTSYELQKKYTDKLYITLPKYLQDKKIRQIHIIPKHRGKFFEVRYMFDDNEPAKVDVDDSKFLGIDFGINNLTTCVTNDGDSFIIDGKKLKSINQWYNKELSRLSSIKDHQGIKGFTNRQYLITRKRNNRVQDYIYCVAKKIVNYCIEHKIGTIVVGYNDGFQENPNLGKVNNQKFVMIPFGRLKSRIEYLCNQYGIKFILQEESYTSKASFFDKDDMPKWNPLNPKQGLFSGKRIYRGLYQTSKGYRFNSDVNGALNILRKSNLTDLTVLQARGVVNSPLRIRILRNQTSHKYHSKYK